MTRGTGRNPAADTAALRVLAWPAHASQNPYPDLLYSEVRALGAEVVDFTPRELLRGHIDIWHLHWPERFLNDHRRGQALARAGALLALVHLARRRGVRIVWTVHNLRAHEQRYPQLERWFWRAFTGALDGYIALSTGGAEAARAAFPALGRLPGFLVPHGHYRGAYPDAVSRSEARATLGLDAAAPVIASLGQIRPYKNIPELVRAFRALDDPAARLVIAGPIGAPGADDPIIRAAGDDARVLVRPGFIASADVQCFLRAADLVTLPYREILNSASALLALSFDRPVLAPRLGAIGELAALVGDAWLRTYEPPLTTATLAAALDWARARPERRCTGLDGLNWRELGRQTLHAYETIVGRDAVTSPPAPLAAAERA